MKNLSLFLLTIILTYSAGMAQVTLKNYEDPKKSQFVEKIIFGQANSRGTSMQGKSSEQKVFDIQENNPYNKLSYKKEGVSKYGSSQVSFSRSDYQGQRSDNAEAKANLEDGLEYFATSRSEVNLSENGAVLVYSFIPYTKYDLVQELRETTIYCLDKDGNTTFELNLETDATGVTVSENAKYLGYNYGEVLEHGSHDIARGFKIYNTITGELHYEEKNVSAGHGKNRAAGDLLIIQACHPSKPRSVLLNQETGAVYEIFFSRNKGIGIANSTSIVYQGNIMGLSGLKRIK